LAHLLVVLVQWQQVRQRQLLRCFLELQDLTEVQAQRITVPTVSAVAVAVWVALALMLLLQLRVTGALASQVLFKQMQANNMQVAAVRQKMAHHSLMELRHLAVGPLGVREQPVLQIRVAVAVQVIQRQQQAAVESWSYGRSRQVQRLV
jgi:hypothetical protein